MSIYLYSKDGHDKNEKNVKLGPDDSAAKNISRAR